MAETVAGSGAAGGVGRLWRGVRARPRWASAEPDLPAVRVTLPVAWDDAAATALARLGGGAADVSLAAAAQRWLTPVERAGGPDLAARAHAMLLGQVGAPEAAAWGGEGVPGRYRLNLANLSLDCGSDAAPGPGRDAARLDAAARDALAILAALWPGVRPSLVLTGLAGMLAVAGLDYGTAAARHLAAATVRRLRAAAPGARLEAGIPDVVDALLGVETSGLAPAFSPLAAAGGLSRTSLALLAARGVTGEAALAAMLAGETPLPVASAADHAGMDAALRPLLDAAPPLPAPLPRRPARAALPRHRHGIAQRASLGGQKLYLGTGEYADGLPGEVAIGLPQAGPAVRALADALGQAIGIGLQHGAPLADFVDILAGTRFAPAGTVEGDPSVARATSPLDYVARALAAAYLPGMVLPPAEAEPDEAPRLPLELSGDAAPRRRGLRVVK